ncbi:glycosyltransferase family 2 protein [Pararobbsia silviterrae]|uniref:Glycosyltransferase family 2 protein n=1 Tax=Pararobbsia silviterrae TaxID=1792498 RepID=A0A494Y8Y9_9BURK|nr:glycosyltransferase family A protein [Pararobbsia silviterrae]RKP59139.1 glycosyltransferase family 2 protein [Pararobbsia silviterrae]
MTSIRDSFASTARAGSRDAAQPLVTAIVPTYRRASMVRVAVETILAQDYASIEVIVVDDNDDPAQQQAVRDVLEDLGDRVTVIPNHRTKGACGARNSGIERARGDYIAFLDDDDLWLPGKIREQVALLERTSFVAAFCGYIDVDMAFNHARRCHASRPVLQRAHALAGECPTSTSLVMLRKSVLVDAGLFDESLPSFQDFDMWLRCLAKGDFGYIDESLVTFVQHEGERTSVNLDRRLAGLAAIEAKWGREMSAHTDFAAFKRRVAVDALIANGRARMGTRYLVSMRFFARAAVIDHFSKRALFWLAIGGLGAHGGRALYTRLLGMRHIDTVSVAA